MFDGLALLYEWPNPLIPRAQMAATTPRPIQIGTLLLLIHVLLLPLTPTHSDACGAGDECEHCRLSPPVAGVPAVQLPDLSASRWKGSTGQLSGCFPAPLATFSARAPPASVSS